MKKKTSLIYWNCESVTLTTFSIYSRLNLV